MFRMTIRKFFTVVMAIFLLLISYAGYQLWQNNRSVEAPSLPSVRDSLEKAVRWFANHRETVLARDNPILWWFIRESANATGDRRLQALFAEYKARHLDPFPGNIWRNLFDDRLECQSV